MKRLVLGCVVVMVLLVACTTMNEKLAMSRLYSIHTNTANDIRGAVKFDTLLLHKIVRSSDNRIFMFTRATTDETKMYFFGVDYMGTNWLFMDTLMLRIDGQLFTLKDDSPSRETFIKGQAMVRELPKYFIDENILELLLNCSSLVIQYHQDPITIPPEGIEALRNFILEK